MSIMCEDNHLLPWPYQGNHSHLWLQACQTVATHRKKFFKKYVRSHSTRAFTSGFPVLSYWITSCPILCTRLPNRVKHLLDWQKNINVFHRSLTINDFSSKSIEKMHNILFFLPLTMRGLVVNHHCESCE